MNVLVIGLGSAGQRHLRILSDISQGDWEIYVYRGNHKRGLISIDLKEENLDIDPIHFYGACELSEVAEMASKKWDLVIIATPPDSHLSYLQLSYLYADRILIEKPVASDLESATKIQNLAITNDKSILIGYQMHFHKVIQDLLEWIPKLGEIELCRTVFSEKLSSMNPFRDMKHHHLSSFEGGGVFLGLSHDLDIVIKLFEGKSVNSLESKSIERNSVGAIVECEVSFFLHNEAKSIPIEGFFSCSRDLKSRVITIIGSKGVLDFDLNTQLLTIKNTGDEVIFERQYSISKDQLFSDQIKYLIGIYGLNDFCSENLERSMLISRMNEQLWSIH